MISRKIAFGYIDWNKNTRLKQTGPWDTGQMFLPWHQKRHYLLTLQHVSEKLCRHILEEMPFEIKLTLLCTSIEKSDRSREAGVIAAWWPRSGFSIIDNSKIKRTVIMGHIKPGREGDEII